eukprot:TRINITY_DN11579_c0_g1_i1.p1 TRINITY_DN11579_c0_g1~~TRINITY_DN11579_c0_g1_i1.p1  ORF type:complete len:192 (+),score=37.33 TRINITY_DN11579_c0_g1_i1:29-577(+)
MSTITELEIKGAFIVEGQIFKDNRGWFHESYQEEKYSIIKQEWKQVSVSQSKKNVVRGIHCSPYSKLITCITGRVWDVVIDLRVGSPTYLKWIGSELHGARQLYIPPYCGHAFFVMEENTVLMYCQGGVFVPQREMDVNYLDSSINISWPKPIDSASYIISDKDNNAPALEDARKQWKQRNP